MATNNSWNNAIAAANSAITLNSGTNTVSISTDNVVTTVNIGTSGTKLMSLGNGNTNCTMHIQAGQSGFITLDSNGGDVFINTATGGIRIGNDSGSSTIGLGNGDGVSSKIVNVGTSYGTSALGMAYGSGNLSLITNAGSGTINVMTGNNSGFLNYPAQPAFSAYNSTTQSNVTGDGTVYTVQFDTELFDQSSNFDTGTGVFTAPINGKYRLSCNLVIADIGMLHTSLQLYFNLTGKTATIVQFNPNVIAVGGELAINGSILLPMSATDTCSVILVVSGSTKTVDITGGSSSMYQPGFSAELVL